MKQHTTRSWWRRGAFPALAVLAMSLTWACDPPPTRPSPTPGAPPSGGAPSPAPSPILNHASPQPSFARYQVCGRVMDEAGSPIAGAFVALNHGFVQGSSTTSSCPPGGAFCQVSTGTNATGD